MGVRIAQRADEFHLVLSQKIDGFSMAAAHFFTTTARDCLTKSIPETKGNQNPYYGILTKQNHVIRNGSQDVALCMRFHFSICDNV